MGGGAGECPAGEDRSPACTDSGFVGRAGIGTATAWVGRWLGRGKMDIQNLFTMHLGLHGSYGYTGLHDFDAGSMSILCTIVSSLGVGMGGAGGGKKKVAGLASKHGWLWLGRVESSRSLLHCDCVVVVDGWVSGWVVGWVGELMGCGWMDEWVWGR